MDACTSNKYENNTSKRINNCTLDFGLFVTIQTTLSLSHIHFNIDFEIQTS